ncbi:DUF859 family phage minor structural protein [Streptococcus ferus]|uniref:DUF859 family phage minor structural protein n=1 Tax=Streptococcus ferus TaxID=1345 RepID=UPI003519A01F
MSKWSFFSGTDLGKYMSLTIDCQQISQSIISNSSEVRLTAFISTNSGAQSATANLDITIRLNGGGAIERKTFAIKPSNGVFVLDNTYTITHDDTGIKELTYEIVVNTNNSKYGLCSLKDTLTLTPIPREDDITVENGVFGENIKISIGQNADNFKHNLRYDFLGNVGTIAENVVDSYNWTAPLDLVNHIPSDVRGEITLYCDTLLNEEIVGTKQQTITLTVPDSVKPVLNDFDVLENNPKVLAIGLDANYFVQTLSQITAQLKTAAGSYSSTINRFVCYLSTGALLDSAPLSVAQTGKVQAEAYVIDSRNRKSDTVVKELTFLQYDPPAMQIEATRSGASNTTATITRNVSVSPLAINGKQHNVMKLKLEYALAESDNFTKDDGAGGSWTDIAHLINSSANMTATFDEAKTYKIRVTLSDAFVTQTTSTILFMANNYTFSYDANQRFAVGKVTDNDLPNGSIESTGGYYINGKELTQIVESAVMSKVNALISDLTASINAEETAVFANGKAVRRGTQVFLTVVYRHETTSGARTLFTLPESMRPKTDISIAITEWTTLTGKGLPLFIAPNGNVYLYANKGVLYQFQANFTTLL